MKHNSKHLVYSDGKTLMYDNNCKLCIDLKVKEYIQKSGEQSMDTQEIQEWEKEFDEKFTYQEEGFSDPFYDEDTYTALIEDLEIKDLKSFISQKIKEQRAKILNDIFDSKKGSMVYVQKLDGSEQTWECIDIKYDTKA